MIDAVKSSPVYVELNVDPYDYQLYSKYSTQPLKVSTSASKRSIAGVLTGFDTTSDGGYWELYVRRHGSANNQVRVAFDAQSVPYGGMQTYAFTLSTNDITYQNSTYVVEYVGTKEDLANVPYYVTQMTIIQNSLNDITVLDLSIYNQLETLIIEDNCLNAVTTLVTPSRLASISIGSNSLSRMPTSRRLRDRRSLRSEREEEEALLKEAEAAESAERSVAEEEKKVRRFRLENQSAIKDLSFSKGSLNGVEEFVMKSK